MAKKLFWSQVSHKNLDYSNPELYPMNFGHFGCGENDQVHLVKNTCAVCLDQRLKQETCCSLHKLSC